MIEATFKSVSLIFIMCTIYPAATHYKPWLGDKCCCPGGCEMICCHAVRSCKLKLHDADRSIPPVFSSSVSGLWNKNNK